MTVTGANNAPAVVEHPGAGHTCLARCNVPDRTYAPDAESTDYPHARGLPDDPNLEMELAAGRLPPSPLPGDWHDAVCRGCGDAIFVRPGDVPLCTRCERQGDDDPEPPSGSALFPEIPTWTDEQLVVAIELADLREPGLGLYAVGNLPDRHEAFLHECSAELVRRLEKRGARFAA